MKKRVSGFFILFTICFCLFAQIVTKEYSSIKECPEGEELLIIKSSVPGSYVYLNGEYQGKAPVKIKNLFPNYYTIRVSKKGYADQEEMVELKSGCQTEYYFVLEKE